MCTSWLAFALLSLFLQRCVFQHLGYSLSLDSQPCTAVYNLDTLRVGALLHTHCLGGPCSDLEGSPLNYPVFLTVLEG